MPAAFPRRPGVDISGFRYRTGSFSLLAHCVRCLERRKSLAVKGKRYFFVKLALFVR